MLALVATRRWLARAALMPLSDRQGERRPINGLPVDTDVEVVIPAQDRDLQAVAASSTEISLDSPCTRAPKSQI